MSQWLRVRLLVRLTSCVTGSSQMAQDEQSAKQARAQACSIHEPTTLQAVIMVLAATVL